MPLFLRALPLSIATLWHYVFLLPLVIVVVTPFTLLALIPLAGWPVAVGIVTFVSFAGYRCALAAFGKGNEPSFDRLVISSVVMGMINSLASLLFMCIGFAVEYGLQKLGISFGIRVPAMFSVPFAGALAAAIYMVLMLLYTCAMAVPMTAVARAATPRGRDPGPFSGFGAGTFSLLLSLILGVAGFVYLGFIDTILSAIATGIEMLFNLLMSSPGAVEVAADAAQPVETEAFDWIGLAIAVVYSLWMTCWFCATAVLAWDRRLQRQAPVETVIAKAPKVSADELRAMREARMPTHDHLG